jgi:hypothetical protein
MKSVRKAEMHCGKNCPGHATAITFIPGDILKKAYGMLLFKPFHRDQEQGNGDEKHPNAENKPEKVLIF